LPPRRWSRPDDARSGVRLRNKPTRSPPSIVRERRARRFDALAKGRASRFAIVMVDFSPEISRSEEAESPQPMPIAVVAVNAPVVRPFSYRIPEALRGRVQLGSRVAVPFGTRRLAGTVIGFQSESPVAELKDIQSVLADEARMTPALMQLCLWMAEYYSASV